MDYPRMVGLLLRADFIFELQNQVQFANDLNDPSKMSSSFPSINRIFFPTKEE
jgi:tryptophanyl-tRNA synthetase